MSAIALAILALEAPAQPTLSPETPVCAETREATGLHSWPRCVDVTFTGHGVTGLAPLTFRWTVSNGLTFSGNPGVLRTELLAPGSYTAQLRVTNPWGSAQSQPVVFAIEPLAFSDTPIWTNLGGRVVAFEARTTGATDYRWEWGDGTVSPWLQGCDGARPTHTYPAAGTYSARLSIRNCADPAQTGAFFPVTVTAEPQLAILHWQAFCPFGFCIFDVGEDIFFTTLTQGSPTTYAYDWNGDGLVDQISGQPVVSHRYSQAGTFTPRLTISRGTLVASQVHHLPLFLKPGTPGPIFADGFESGDFRAWAVVVGAQPGATEP